MDTKQQYNVFKTDIEIKAPVELCWRMLVNKQVFERITGKKCTGNLVFTNDKGNGVLAVDPFIFYVKASPYTIEANSMQVKIRIILTEDNRNTKLIISATILGKENNFDISKTITKLISDFKNFAESYLLHISDKESSQPPVSARQEEEPSNFILDETPSTEVSKVNKPSSGLKRKYAIRSLLFFLLILLLLSSLFYFGADRIMKRYDTQETRTGNVNFKNAEIIEIGSSKNDIRYLMSSSGNEKKNNESESEIVFGSNHMRSPGVSSQMISVLFDTAGRAKRISYLDTAASSEHCDAFPLDFTIDSSMTVEEILDGLGCPLSLYRHYETENSDEVVELHFGYLDPKANFDPAWRGEYVVTINRTSGYVDIKNWGRSTGSDPLMVDTLTGTPLEHQYDNYSEFLNDYFHYRRFGLLKNRYSRGDLKFFFDNEPEFYSTSSGLNLYTIDSIEKIEGTDTPRCRIVVGYDYSNKFQTASFSILPLYEKKGTLVDCDLKSVTRGMSLNEVASVIGILPTAVYIDSGYYSLCYGSYLETDVADEQFEVIVRFDPIDLVAKKVLINTAVASVSN
ncbi:MAG: hypothetical protein GX222_01730 [Ruminococcaceae bacterium]|nr:hypothetical protein [Oscillospiraceae bacterium]